jgi:hypothetical protein
MKQPLFMEGFGSFSAVKVDGFAPRHLLADIRGQGGDARDKMRRELLEEVVATATDKASVRETPSTFIYTQPVGHPRLQWGTRIVEIWKSQPRARLTFRLNRTSSAAPEIFYLDFPLPTSEALPRMSVGGQPFTPFTDQLSGTCRDYFAIDGWANYATPEGQWLWVSRDAPLVTFGASPTLASRTSPPKDSNRLRAMLFNNFWYTNFAADEHGIMEFQFDLVWHQNPDSSVPSLAEALVVEPLVLISPATIEDSRVIQNLYKP